MRTEREIRLCRYCLKLASQIANLREVIVVNKSFHRKKDRKKSWQRQCQLKVLRSIICFFFLLVSLSFHDPEVSGLPFWITDIDYFHHNGMENSLLSYKRRMCFCHLSAVACPTRTRRCEAIRWSTSVGGSVLMSAWSVLSSTHSKLSLCREIQTHQ